MVRGKLEQKLERLNVFPDKIDVSAKIFEKCSTLKCINNEAESRHWGCNSTQFVYLHLQALLVYNLNFKAEFFQGAKEKFIPLGIKPEHIEEYFQTGDVPAAMFTQRHGKEYNWEENLQPFYQQADQYSLDEVRGWLGIIVNH